MENLEFLKQEREKVVKTLSETNPTNYKKYATLSQLYLTFSVNIAQLEAIEKQKEEEKRREEEIRLAEEEARKELENETKSE